MSPLRPLASALSLSLACLLVAACGSPTGVDSVTVSLRTIPFATEEELQQWPATPTIEGGESVIVRGRAFVGCGRPEAAAWLRYRIVGLAIRAVDTDRMCLGIVASWVPFEATVSGLAPGTYRVRVGTAGLSERIEGTVTITPP